jgi:hypothetical protein
VVDIGGTFPVVVAGLLLDLQRGRAGEALGHRVDGGDRIDAVAEVVARTALEEAGRVGGQPADVGEEGPIAGLGERLRLLLRRLAGKIVAAAGEQLDEALPRLVREGAIGQEGGRWPRAGIVGCELVEAQEQRVAVDEPVLAERLAVEEHRLGEPEARIELAVEHALALEALRIDAQPQDAPDLARIFDPSAPPSTRAAVAQQQPVPTRNSRAARGRRNRRGCRGSGCGRWAAAPR